MKNDAPEPDEREIALDALLIDGLLARDPSLGRVSPKLASKLAAIGKAEAARRGPRVAPGARTSGRRLALAPVPLAVRTSGRVRRPAALRGHRVWSSAAALLAVAAVAAWLVSDASKPEGAATSGGASTASSKGAVEGRGDALARRADAGRTSQERGGGSPSQAGIAGGRESPFVSGARADEIGGGAEATQAGAAPSTVASTSTSPGTRDAADRSALARAGAASDDLGISLPGEEAPLGAEELAPALAGPLPPLPSPTTPAGGAPRTSDQGGAVVSASPLKSGKIVRASIGFETPLAAFEGALIPGGAAAATRAEGGRVLEAKEAKGDALAGVRAAVRRSALVEARAGTSIAFSYYLAQPAAIALHSANETQGRLFRAALEKPVTGKWTRVVLALADLRRIGAGDGDGLVHAGDLLGSIEVVAGAPGETVRLLIDDVEVTDRAP